MIRIMAECQNELNRAIVIFTWQREVSILALYDQKKNAFLDKKAETSDF